LPAPGGIDGLAVMGSKYHPTNRDQKLKERFQRQQSAHPKFQKSASAPTAKKLRKK